MKKGRFLGPAEEKMTSNSAATVAETDDLLIEILTRVPTKPLLKFKCVSKRWLSLISNPQFGASHFLFQQRLNPSPTALLINDFYYNAPNFHIIPLNTEKLHLSFDYLNFPHVHIHQSSNGLLLLCSSFLVSPTEKFLPDYHSGVYRCSSVVTDDDRGFVYFLCNPTTRQFKRISFPSPLKQKLRIPYPLLYYQHHVMCICVAFDPKRSPYYKIIVMLKMIKSTVEIYTYSSETDSWTSRTTDVTDLCIDGEFSPIKLGIGFYSGFYCNGAIHWFRNIGIASVVYFDIDNEIFKKLPLPPELNVWYFGESLGLLYVIGYRNSSPPLDYVVLEMGADYSEWLVKYDINLESLRSESPELSWNIYKALSIIRGKDEKESVMVILVDGVVMTYKVSDGTSKTIFDLEWEILIGRCTQHISSPYQYLETLYCV
ncbi:hypothetical protein P3X46_015670 [Hevea brasiliensis]|uniref:F-box domain-containing protein n=1 Tax=Hevea brasiliensis TaxID=3981 RepID=A0ABQ9LWN5_HEVBR|nr:F-box protein At5g07610 isoform X2 [Hevea brasiliensis]KAJ9172429.1 hypothetical protein P3X46_015670 [Hevea brasiliensis]